MQCCGGYWALAVRPLLYPIAASQVPSESGCGDGAGAAEIGWIGDRRVLLAAFQDPPR